MPIQREETSGCGRQGSVRVSVGTHLCRRETNGELYRLGESFDVAGETTGFAVSRHATKGQFMVVPLGSLSNSEADKVQGSHADTLVEVSGLEPPTSTLRT